jgi:hypothetical protein
MNLGKDKGRQLPLTLDIATTPENGTSTVNSIRGDTPDPSIAGAGAPAPGRKVLQTSHRRLVSDNSPPGARGRRQRRRDNHPGLVADPRVAAHKLLLWIIVVDGDQG